MKFDELREKIKTTCTLGLEEILLVIVDELEKVHKELRQGYTKVEE